MQNKVVSINRTGNFSLSQARQLLPIIRKITEEYKTKVEAVMSRLETVDIENTPLIDLLEGQINELLSMWNKKISRLGGIPKGLWLVDFDSGDGLYCWRHPETDITYWHAYGEGMHGRVRIQDKVIVDETLST